MVADIVIKRIEKLFREASKADHTHPERADRYVRLAWQLKLATNAAFTADQKMHFCKRCKRYTGPTNRRVRCNEGVLTRTCKYCGHHQRIRYGP